MDKTAESSRNGRPMGGPLPNNDEEDCVYTYKGEPAADLPSSFYKFSSESARGPEEPGPSSAAAFSPDMDFLEMDFDPGGGGEEEGEPESDESGPPAAEPNMTYGPNCPPPETPVKDHALPKFSLRLVKSNTLPEIGRGSGASSLSPALSEPVIVQPHFRAVINAGRDVEDYSVELEVGSVMIWTMEEAGQRGILQIGVSACGATAVMNVLTALGYAPFPPQTVTLSVNTRVRAELADLPEYLFSRSQAGSTDRDLISGVEKLTDGGVCGRFFRVGPTVKSDLFAKWVLSWICKGAVPVLTRNLQVGSSSSDSWVHQMVFGVSPGVLYLANPVECVEIDRLLPQLSSPSVLLIRRSDVVGRRSLRTDLRRLARHEDGRWNEMNVLGQVANVILEDMPSTVSEGRRLCTAHVRIPADYRGGVTLFMHRADSPALTSAAEL